MTRCCLPYSTPCIERYTPFLPAAAQMPLVYLLLPYAAVHTAPPYIMSPSYDKTPNHSPNPDAAPLPPPPAMLPYAQHPLMSPSYIKPNPNPNPNPTCSGHEGPESGPSVSLVVYPLLPPWSRSEAAFSRTLHTAHFTLYLVTPV